MPHVDRHTTHFESCGCAEAKIEGLAKELADEQHGLGVICEEVSIVYDTVTFGRFSKPNTAAEHIIAAVEERTAQQIEDAEEPLKVEIGELRTEKERLHARVRELEAVLEHGCCIDRLHTMLRQRGYVFNTPLDAPVTDTNRWEKLAFTLWTELAEIDQVSRAALKGDADDAG
jgi:hypothetical protein